MPASRPFTVLHYLGYDQERGGIVAIVRALAAAGRFGCVLGMNRGHAPGSLPAVAFSPVPGERLNLRTFLGSRAAAREARAWLAADPQRIFHGHSRAGLAAALWLHRWGERRAVVSVHCYGRQRWFYRWAAGRLGHRLFWLSPAMKRYYRLADGSATWDQCVPGCVAGTPQPKPALPRTPDVIRIGGAGALVSWKRWHLLLDALAAIPSAARSKFQFIHIGGDDGTDESRRYAAALRQQAAALRLERQVEWRGPQPSSAGLLAEIDCLALPSRHEPFSIAMLESLFAGVPVLAATSGGARDVVGAGRNGWLFRSGDARDLSRSLAMLGESDALQRIAIDSSRLAQFSADAIAGHWQEIYASVAPSAAGG